MEVLNLEVLDIGQNQIESEVICLRPGHKSGLPQIYFQEKNEKLIFNIYGLSGVGYSILFGAVNKCIRKFLKKKVDVKEKIFIVGTGCAGILTALTLSYLNYQNIFLLGEQERYFNSASYNAGGLIEFSLTTIYNKEDVQKMNLLFRESFLEYQKILQNKHDFIKDCFSLKKVNYFTDFYQEQAGLHFLSELGIIPKPKKVTITLGTNPRKIEVTQFETFNVDSSSFMNHLWTLVKQKPQIKFQQQKVYSFDQLQTKVVFNCSGNSSQYLVNDFQCQPICGHGFNFNNPSNGKINYILRLSSMPGLTQEHPINGSLYFMPKSKGFIGGTYIKDYNGKDSKINQQELQKLYQRAQYLFTNYKPKL